MKAVKDLCVRLINRKTYDKETILDMISVYKENKKLTEAEYDELVALIEETY